MRIRQLVEAAAQWSEGVGVAAVLLMLGFTVVDVVGAKVFLRPLPGASDLVGFTQVVAMAGGMTMAFIAGRHIQIDFVVSRFPPALQRVISGVNALLGLGLFVILAWQSYLYGQSLQAAGQVSSTGDLPFYPFAYALAGFSVVTALYFVAELVGALCPARALRSEGAGVTRGEVRHGAD